VATAFLDTQIWNYLVGSKPIGLGEVTPEDLLAAVRRYEIVGSFDVLQEIMGAGRKDSSKCKHMVELFFELIGSRLLLPLDARHIGEARAGGLLTPDKRFVSRDLRRDAKSAAKKQRTIREVADDVHVETVEFKEEEEAVRAALTRELAAASESTKPQRLKEWYEALDIDDWVRSVVVAGKERGYYTIEVQNGCGFNRFPSVWTFVACRLARIPATLGEGRRINTSDLADAHHVANGPYVDLLVTNDRQLRYTIELMQCRSLPFRCVSIEEFVTL
jgi:hypothetical protein